MSEESSPLDGLPLESFLRVRLLTVRVTIEQLAADAYSKVAGTSTRQSRIQAKLLCLLPAKEDPRWLEDLRTVRLAQYCYRRTSDVLHGRSSLVGLTSAMVDEWEAIATDVERLHRARFPPRADPP